MPEGFDTAIRVVISDEIGTTRVRREVLALERPDHASDHQILRQDWPVRPRSKKPQPRYTRTESEGTLRTMVSGGMMGQRRQRGAGGVDGETAEIDRLRR